MQKADWGICKKQDKQDQGGKEKSVPEIKSTQKSIQLYVGHGKEKLQTLCLQWESILCNLYVYNKIRLPDIWTGKGRHRQLERRMKEVGEKEEALFDIYIYIHWKGRDCKCVNRQVK